MSTQSTQDLPVQIRDLGVNASYFLDDSTRALRAMAADMQASAARLITIADAVAGHRDALNEQLGQTPGLDFRLGNAVTQITDVAFGALNTTNLVSRAEQAVTAANRAVEAVNTARVLSENL